MFVLMAAGAGLLVGRFLRGAKDVSSDGDGEPRRGPERVPTSAGAAPPAFPPTAPDGTRPQTTGGEHDVERP